MFRQAVEKGSSSGLTESGKVTDVVVVRTHWDGSRAQGATRVHFGRDV